MQLPSSGRDVRADALAIWRAGVEAVDSAHLVRQAVRVEDGQIIVDDFRCSLPAVRRIAVVGAGKAGAGMAAGLVEALGSELAEQKHLTGWLNVPADCVRPLDWIHLHAARPAGRNEPTVEGVRGADEMLRLVAGLGPEDLCICLLSGGGSALLPAPADGVSLEDKLAVTRTLSEAGANIAELNAVRKQLSRLKGGGLARACRAGSLVTLIVSDVLGDPLDVIASGPTVPDTSTPTDALAILERFQARQRGVPESVFDYLARRRNDPQPAVERPAHVVNLVIGNNATAVDAAGMAAEKLGYSHAMLSTNKLEGSAESVGRHLAEMALRMRSEPGPNCLISGGEPVVTLIDAAERGLGGRNQQLVLAALDYLGPERMAGLVLLSGGTDGEDGPTDAAGAVADAQTLPAAQARGMSPADYLRRNDAYHFFEPLGGLIKTGPTHTNVCDVRVVLVEREP